MANNPTETAPLSLGFTSEQLAEMERLFNVGNRAAAQQIIFNMLVNERNRLTGNSSTHHAANTG